MRPPISKSGSGSSAISDGHVTRILVVSNMYPPHHLGGYELTCRDVMDGLRDRGHEIEILTTTMRLPHVREPADERAHGIHRELEFYWDDHRLLSPSLARRLAIERGNQRAIAAAIARLKPDVVSSWNMGAMSLGLLTTVVERRIPLVLMVCDEWPWYAPKIDPWMRMFDGREMLGRIVRRLAGVPTAIPDLGEHAVFCYVSDMIRRSVEQKSRWASPRIAGVVYSGINIDEFPVPAKPPLPRPWRWKLLHVGRLDERKGIHVLIDALALLPGEATLDIIGRGDERYAEQLRSQVARLGLTDRVTFGMADRRRLRERYAAADAFVFPVIWEEPLGLVPLEAMACATPVVGTGTGGSGEYLLDGVNSLIVPTENAEATAAAVRRLGDDPSLRERLVAGGLRAAAELSLDRYTDIVEEWHVAAAGHFATGHPPDRRLELN
jgi:glycogen synthase